MQRRAGFLALQCTASLTRPGWIRSFSATTAFLNNDSWLKGIFDRPVTGDVAVGPHAARLAESQYVYEMQIHKVKPRFMEDYLKQYTNFASIVNSKKLGAELVGSWTVEIGDQDEAIHIWRYVDYKSFNNFTKAYRTEDAFVDFRQERNRMIGHRKNLIMMKFSFWNEPEPRQFFGPDPSIYELRTYSLKPGNLIEWGNLWARGIKFRQLNNEAVCGWFEQMGNLYTVHHLWNYKDMHTRKETREAAWRHPGWDENVAYTVPLIRKMRSRILIPTPFSPLK